MQKDLRHMRSPSPDGSTFLLDAQEARRFAQNRCCAAALGKAGKNRMNAVAYEELGHPSHD